jgi:hypothetical protein
LGGGSLNLLQRNVDAASGSNFFPISELSGQLGFMAEPGIERELPDLASGTRYSEQWRFKEI